MKAWALVLFLLTGCSQLDRLLTGREDDPYTPPATRTMIVEVWDKSPNKDLFGAGANTMPFSVPLISVKLITRNWVGDLLTFDLPAVPDATGAAGYLRKQGAFGGSTFEFYWLERDYPLAYEVHITWRNT